MDMFEEGQILYFTPFYFRNGNPPKNKFFVVLKKNANSTIIVSLPTSKDYIPENAVVESGCVEIPKAMINCFVISNKVPVTDCGKCFTLKTYIYGGELATYEIQELSDTYPQENVDYQIFGKMKKSIFDKLINCIKDSNSVKRKYKRALSE
jgi:hypothetical protein